MASPDLSKVFGSAKGGKRKPPAAGAEKDYGDLSPDFVTAATDALGTDDPGKIMALKEAIVICFEEHESGGYEAPMEELAE